MIRRRTISRETRLAVWEKTKGRCWYCGTKVVPQHECWSKKQNIEHQTPVCKGGPDAIENLVLCCVRCNSYKGLKNLVEYRQEVGEMLANSIGNAINALPQVRFFWGSLISQELDAQLNDLASLCRRAHLLFYGEMLYQDEPQDYQI